MRSGKCPKCSSEQVYHRGSKNPKFANSLQTSLMEHLQTDSYVCVECGYIEHYVVGGTDAVKKAWEPV